MTQGLVLMKKAKVGLAFGALTAWVAVCVSAMAQGAEFESGDIVVELYDNLQCAAPPVWSGQIDAGAKALDEVTRKVAAQAADVSGPILLFLYVDNNGNGIREGEEPAQFRIIDGAADAAEFEVSPVRECPYWGWNALQRAQAEDQGPRVSFVAPSSSDASEKGSKFGEVDGGYAASTYSPGPLLYQTNGLTGLPAPGDFDGDGRDDVCDFQPPTGTWRIQYAAGGTTNRQFGYYLTVPVQGDYDGDGITDIGVCDTNAFIWYISKSSNGGLISNQYGYAGTYPFPKDYDGDGESDKCVVDLTTGGSNSFKWYIWKSAANSNLITQFGFGGCKPVPADYDADGKADIAVFYPPTASWHLQRSTAGYVSNQFGWYGPKPVPADFDGDGTADLAIFDQTNGNWWIRLSGNIGVTNPVTITNNWGYAATDPVVPMDYDGDERNDLVVRSQSTTGSIWYVRQSMQADIDSDGMADGCEWPIVDYLTNDSIKSIWQVAPGADFDGDGISNEDECDDGTDPTVPNVVTLSGTNSYAGAWAGPVRTLAATAEPAWTSLYQAATASPGSFQITNATVMKTYWIKAYRDANTNNALDSWEPRGEYGANPLVVTTAPVSGLSVVISDLTNISLTDGLAAWYKLDETNGTTVVDSSGSNNVGTLTGATAQAATVWGPIWRGLDLDGVNDGIDVPSSSSISPTSGITVAAWVRPWVSNGIRQAIFQKGGAYYLNIRDGKPQFYWYGVQAGSYVVANTILPVGVWSHLAVTYDKTAVVFYVNGQVAYTHLTNGTGVANSNPLGIGFGGVGSDTDRWLNGSLDDARLYNRALSAGQVRTLYDYGADEDLDGLGNLDELAYGAHPEKWDTDGDGTDDGDEVHSGTDPTVPNVSTNPPSISGVVTYKGSSTGQVVVLASTAKFAWTSQWRQVLAAPGAYTLTNLVAGTDYWVKAFRDLNSNGLWEGKEPPYFRITNVFLTAAGATNINVHVEKTRGYRVDFSYESGNTTNIVNGLVSNAVKWGANTIYAYAMTYESGTYWAPTGLYLRPVIGKGQENILPLLLSRAHSNSLKVIAWVQPANALFKDAYHSNATWRQVKWDGSYHTSSYLLSPYNTNFLNWMDSVMGEILDLGVDGIDVSETYINKDGGGSTGSTYDAAANLAFSNRYPGMVINGTNTWVPSWKNLRTDILTSNIYERIGKQVNAKGREFHVTFNWTHDKTTGVLWTPNEISNSFSFSYNRIMDLPDDARPEFVCPEILWQAENPSHTNPILNPGWTYYGVTTVVAFASNRVILSTHVEYGTVNSGVFPTVAENNETTGLAITNSGGVDFYMHLYPGTNPPLAAAVSNIFRSSP